MIRFAHWMALCSFLLPMASSAAAEPTAESLQAAFRQLVRPFLDQYCLECHDQLDPEAKLDLSIFRDAEDVIPAHETWSTLRQRLAAEEMPPEDASSRPSRDQRQAVIHWIDAQRQFVATQNAGDPGTVLARRLSNAEFNYSIRDLTGVDIRPTDTFPVDPANEAGFDNSGESLAMSPALLNKYLAAARRVTEHLVLTPTGIDFAPHPAVTDTDRDKYCVKRIIEFYERQPVDVADYFFACWRSEVTAGSLLETAAEQQVSARYLQTVWSLLNEEEDDWGPIAKLREMWRAMPEDASQHREARESCEAMRDFVMALRAKFKKQVTNLSGAGVHKGSQTFVLWKNRQYAAQRMEFDPAVLDEVAAEEFQVAGFTLQLPVDPTRRAGYLQSLQRFCAVFPDAFYISERGRDYLDEPNRYSEKGRLLSAGFHSMMGYFRDDTPLYQLILNDAQRQELDRLWEELDYIASAPMRQYAGFLWFERTDSRFMRDPEFDFARAEDKAATGEEMIRRLSDIYLAKVHRQGGDGPVIEAVEDYFRNINTQIRHVERLRHEAKPRHIKALLALAMRAYRRPLETKERLDLQSFYHQLRQQGLVHEEAIQDVMVSILMSPHFCYRLDLLGGGEQRRPLTAIELASRLSYFLWSSIPDAELLELAQTAQLPQHATLLQQTQRMLRDERVLALATEFGGNWLDFRRFQMHNSVDRGRFPEFNDALREAMYQEPIRFFLHVIQQDQSVKDFLYADYTFANAVLARHYQISDVDFRTDTWVRVDAAHRYDRGGLLPMSVFLTKNSPGLRTSPVKRGYWVVRQLLGERIPPPPPDVPELPDDESKLGELTLPQMLAQHREHPNCAACHDRFDAIGLAFEGFGPVGERREFDLGGRPVMTTARFPGAEAGAGLSGLRSYLASHRAAEFLDNLCRKLLTYALGRTLLLSDEPLLEKMLLNLQRDDYRFSSLVASIVSSEQFLEKRIRAGQADVAPTTNGE